MKFHLYQFHSGKDGIQSTFSLQMLRPLYLATILAGALAGSAMAQAPDASCALPSEPEGIPAALDAAITGPADKDRACMKALLKVQAWRSPSRREIQIVRVSSKLKIRLPKAIAAFED